MPNRDNAFVLDLVLERLAAHTRYPDVELVVVDDGSTDGSRDLIRRWRDSGRFGGDFHLIEHEHTDGGVVDALNRGLGAATGELVVQLDADASIETPGWLEKMVSFFVSDPRIGALNPRVLKDSGVLDTCGIEVVGPEGYYNRGSELTEAVGERTHVWKERPLREDEWPLCEQLAEVDGGTGVCLMYRRGAALEIGGYDRGYAPVWLDDLDLTISLRKLGLKVFYLPDVRVIHHLGKRARPVEQSADPSSAARARHRLRGAVGSVLPASARVRLIHALRWDRGTWQRRRWIAAHLRYWRKKWGWDMLNPDVAAIYQRWGETEICWAMNPEMREAGEAIIAAYQSAGAAPDLADAHRSQHPL